MSDLKPIATGKPYYDTSFDSEIPKNYIKELFNPSVAIQSRELTSLQSVMQNQISNIASYLFSNGSPISGAKITINKNSFFIQAEEKDINGLVVDFESLIGKVFVGSASGQSIQVINVDAARRYVYFRFLGGDIVEGENFVSVTTPFRHFTTIKNTYGAGITAYNEPGTLYIDGYFIYVNSGSLVLYPWEGEADVPIEWHVGYQITKNIITASEDGTLLDNATGSYNYNSPGADRYQINATLAAYRSTDDFPQDFLSGVIISNGVIIKDQITNADFRYEDILAKRTYDESGSYSVNPWLVYNSEETISNDPEKYTTSIQPGLGYIYGYEVQNLISVPIENDRSRTWVQNLEKRIFYSNNYYTYGNYDPNTNTLDSNGLLDYSKYEEIELCTEKNGAGSVVGKANILGYERMNNRFVIYLDNVSNIIALFPSVKSLRSAANNSIWINLFLNESNLASIYGNTVPKIIDSGYEYVRDINNNTIDYVFTKTYQTVSEQSGNTILISELDRNLDFIPGSQNIIAIINNVSGKNIYLGDLTATPNNSGTSSYLNLFSPAIENGVSYSVVANINVTNLNSRIKSLKEVTYTYSAPAKITDIVDELILPMEDGYKLVSVIQQNNIATDFDRDVAKFLEFNNGQTDSFYDRCKVTGWTNPDLLKGRASTGTQTNYVITYQYYEHTGFGPFTVNSYTGVDNSNIFKNQNLDVYTQIYKYKSSNGTTYTLRDCIDFRIKKSDIGKPNMLFCNTNNEIVFQCSQYQPRIDLVWVSRDKTFGITNGIPSLFPEPPETKDGTMNIAWLYNKPYTNDVQNMVTVTYFKNQRYTMEDIGKLSQNLSILTEAIALAQLERNSLDIPVLDQDGLNMYKTGIFTDNFANYNNSNFQDPLYSVCIDYEEQSIRAGFNLNHMLFKPSGEGINYIQKDVTISKNYTTTVYTQNLARTSTVNIQDMMFYVWEGAVKLVPSIDTWIIDKGEVVVASTYEEKPQPSYFKSWKESYTNHGNSALTAQLRAQGYLDRWGNPLGTKGNDWGFGLGAGGHGATFEVTETAEYEGTWQASIINSIPREIVNQFMRENTVTYTLSGMRPSTPLRAYFDGIEIQISNNTPDTNGNLTGTFKIPANTPVGTKIVEFYDYAKTQYATGQYTGNSKTIWKDVTVKYIREWNLVRTVRRAIAVADYDPLAQTFFVSNPEGIYVDSIDIFFDAKDAQAGVELYIVETDNGYPTDNIVPFAYKQLSPSQVKLGAENPTKFQFDSPVYLYGETEYAFVVATSTTTYSLWQSVLGEKDVVNGKNIQEQPFLGSLFKSQNNRTWTAYQNADLTFILHRCKFDLNTTNVIFEVDTETAETEIPFEVVMTTFTANTFEPSATSAKFEYMFADESNWTEFKNRSDFSTTSVKTISQNSDLRVRVTLESTLDTITPQIDTEQIYGIFTNNAVEESTVYEDWNYFAGTYISNTTQLKDSSKSINVIFDAIKPNNALIDVFCKVNTTSPPFLLQATQGPGSFNENILDQTGKTFRIYYYNNSTKKLEPFHDLIITGYDETSRKIYVRSVANTDEFYDLVNTANENVYNGLNPNYTGIFLLDIIDDALIDCPTWSGQEYSTVGNRVMYGNCIWENIQSPVLSTYRPSELSTIWKILPAYKVVSKVRTEPILEWRKMREVKEYTSDYTTVDKENRFIEYRYEPEIQIEQEFMNFATRIDMYSMNKINIPRIKNFRCIAIS